MSESAVTIEQTKSDLNWIDAGNWPAMKEEGFRYLGQLSEPTEGGSSFGSTDYLERLRLELGPENVILGEAFDIDAKVPVIQDGKQGIYVRR